jgi:hypothetical protein
VRRALHFLLEALQVAQTLQRDAWEFAVEIGQLRAAGLTHTDLRWLLCRGYAEHAEEGGGEHLGKRCFRRLDSLTLPEQTCFILTAAGAEVAAGAFPRREEPTPRHTSAPGTSAPEEAGLPHWDAMLRQLHGKGHLIKEFRRPAASQEVILAALEEEGWVARIDDPLPGEAGLDPKARLHDAIKNLNRNQVHPLLRFRGDGTGSGVLWEWRASPEGAGVP